MVPSHGFPPHDEREVLVFYDLSHTGPAAVLVPASGPDLIVLWMRTDPPNLHETFDGGQRHFHAPGEALTIRCRYRAYVERGARVPGLPTPEELFPGATSISTVWHGAQ